MIYSMMTTTGLRLCRANSAIQARRTLARSNDMQVSTQDVKRLQGLPSHVGTHAYDAAVNHLDTQARGLMRTPNGKVAHVDGFYKQATQAIERTAAKALASINALPLID